MAADGRWQARSRYWKGSGLAIVVIAFFVPLVDRAELGGGAVLAAAAAPIALWLWRVAAWEEDDALVVRNFFGTKRIPWSAITKLSIGHTIFSSDYCYVTAHHGIGRTRIKALALVFVLFPNKVVEEARDLARRRNLEFDESGLDGLPGRIS